MSTTFSKSFNLPARDIYTRCCYALHASRFYNFFHLLEQICGTIDSCPLYVDALSHVADFLEGIN